MQKTPKLVLDTFCEVHDLLKPWVTAEFWNLDEHEVVPGAIYVIGRQQTIEHALRIKQLVNDNIIKVVHCNPHEGSETLLAQCQKIDMAQLMWTKKILLIGGGDMDRRWPCLRYDSFLPKVYDYEENLAAAACVDKIYSQPNKPYKFLFLNGRMRSHRKYLLESFRLSGLLDQSLWTCLDAKRARSRTISFEHNGENLLDTVRPVHYLDPRYEYGNYANNVDRVTGNGLYVKPALFNNDWGEIYIKPEPYIDTYFSLVTETVFEYPHSFRTEKISKPLAIGHPFIVAANRGYYKDLHDLGFQTFGHVIDESFDLIDDNQKRIERIAQVVEDLCRQDLAKFLEQCYTVCKYNQQHLAEIRLKLRQEFPDRFFQFLKEHNFE